MLIDLALKITPRMLTDAQGSEKESLVLGPPGQYDPFLKGDTILKSMISKEEAPHVGKEAQSLDKRKVAVPSGTRL
jgi:hypothetical protein